MGTAVGDALGSPVEGWNSERIRERYGRIEEYLSRGNERAEPAGRWTDDTQFTFAVADELAQGLGPDLPHRVAARYRRLEPRRWGPSTTQAIAHLGRGVSWKDSGADAGPTNGAAMRAAPFGIVWAAGELSKEEAFDLCRPVLEITHGHPASVVAAFGQAFALRRLLLIDPSDLDLNTFWLSLIEMVDWAERMYDHADRSISERLRHVSTQRDASLADLLQSAGGAGIEAASAWPFAVAMFSRHAHDLAAALLETVNAGGDADTTAAMTGAMAGALHGWEAFPSRLKQHLEQVSALLERADALYESLL